MGKILSVLQRKANRFNVENRAHKAISREKPIPAPMHPASKQELERIVKEHPEILQQHLTKDSKLQNRLKEVFVSSHDPVVREPDHVNELNRPLPQERHTYEAPDYGYQDPVMIPHGRFSLRQTMKFLTDHQSDPKQWNAEAIAKEYHINKDITENVLKYFRTFEVFIPEKGQIAVRRVAKPSQPKDQLASGKTDKIE